MGDGRIIGGVPAPPDRPDSAADRAGRPLRLLLVDDHQIVLDGLTAMLRPHRSRVEVVLATTDPEQALVEIGRTAFDVALLDVRIRSTSGLDLCAQIVRRTHGVKVVLLTVYDDEQYLFEALRVGASGFLTKQLVAEDLLAHLDRVAAGETVIDPTMAARVAVAASRLQRGDVWAGSRFGLTHRESEVLELMVRGLSNRSIAAELVLGEETIKSHARSMYRKLGVADRSQAIAFALREGIFR